MSQFDDKRLVNICSKVRGVASDSAQVASRMIYFLSVLDHEALPTPWNRLSNELEEARIAWERVAATISEAIGTEGLH